MPAITDAIVKLSLSDLTTGVPTGAGTFDGLMRSVKAHLMEEFNAGRITGGEYTKAYIALVQVAMTNALQFLLSKEQTYWTSVTAQKNVETVQYSLDNLLPAQLAMANAQKTGQDKANEIAAYNLATTLPAQTAQITAQTSNITAEGLNIPKQGTVLTNQGLQIAQQTLNLVSEELSIDARTALAIQQKTNLVAEALNIPKQGTLVDAQKSGVDKANSIADYNLASLLPAQLTLVKEQGEVQRAQTLEIRADGAAVAGSVKSQKDLYAQQVISYKRSSEVNAAKIFTDAWVADSAIQDSPIVPTAFSSANISSVLTSIKTLNGL